MDYSYFGDYAELDSNATVYYCCSGSEELESVPLFSVCDNDTDDENEQDEDVPSVVCPGYGEGVPTESHWQFVDRAELERRTDAWIKQPTTRRRSETDAPAPSPSSSSAKDIGSAFSGLDCLFLEELFALFPDHSVADWHAVHQYVVELPFSDDFERETRSRMMSLLFWVFTRTSVAFAQRLLEDQLEGAANELQPTNRFGGIAGGDKYVEHETSTIVFKCCADVVPPGANFFLYGGKQERPELAMKAAGHELKSTQALIDSRVAGLHFPMMCVVTYLGKRVCAQSLLPFGSNSRIAQGQTGPGTPLVSTELCDNIMVAVGSALFIGRGPFRIVGPFDLEIHESNGKFYALDTARLMPPESPGRGQTKWYQLLRPELLRIAGVHCAPDAFVVGKRDEHPFEFRRALDTVTNTLNLQVKRLKGEIEAGAVCVDTSFSDLKSALHSRGINMRKLSELGPKVSHFLQMQKEKRDREAEERTWTHANFLEQRCCAPPSLDVKGLRPPIELSEQDLRRLIDLQKVALGDGRKLLHVIPLLLQLASMVGGRIPIREEADYRARPAKYTLVGDHPLAEAWSICTEYDQSTTFDQSGFITSVGGASAPVYAQLLIYRYLHSALSTWKIKWHWESVLSQHYPRSHPLISRLRDLRAGVVHTGSIERALLLAGQRGKFAWVSQIAEHYNVQREASLAAAQFGNMELMTSLVDNCDVDELIDGNRYNALQRAALGGNETMIRYLLENFHFRSPVGPPPLHLAAKNGHACVLDLLISEDLIEHGEALEIAAENGHERAVIRLIQLGFKKVDKALLRAGCHVDVIQCLLDNGANVNAIDGDLRSPLIIAANNVREDRSAPAVHLLLERRANVHWVCSVRTQNALHMAAQRGATRTIQLLLDWGANVDDVDACGCTALRLTSYADSFPDAVRALLVAGANRTVRDDDGFSALDGAERKQLSDEVKQLLTEGFRRPTGASWKPQANVHRWVRKRTRVEIFTCLLCCQRRASALSVFPRPVVFIILRFVASEPFF